jgi:hypothetical protein
MRLSSLVVAVVLLFSSAVFAQHSSTGSAPSSPPPSPPPSAAPSSPPPAAAPSPSPSTSSSSSASASSSPTVSHGSAPSSPSPVGVPASHAAPTPSSSGGHASGSSSDSSTGRTASPVRSSDSGNGRVIPDEKLSGNAGRVVASPRIGEAPPTKEREKESKTPESDLRRRICPNGPCKELEPPAGADLRRRICKDGPCVECPPGQSVGKNGACVGTPSASATVSHQCLPDETWNGSACMPTGPCPPSEVWDGARCVARTATTECASIDARAAGLANEIRGIRAETQTACSTNPSGQQCSDLKQSYDGAVLRYRMLLDEAPVECRATLPDPLSL